MAAYLAPWLVIAIGMATLRLGRLRSHAGQRWNRLAHRGVRNSNCGWPWPLTHSRKRVGFSCTVVGCICLAIWRLSSTGAQRFGRSCWILAIAADDHRRSSAEPWSPLDRRYLDPARALAIRSFQVRIDYWRATRAMIADRPWWGFGPGNFADYYTQYKLPAATEEVRDPHNFALEIATNAGLPGVARSVCWPCWRTLHIACGATTESRP